MFGLPKLAIQSVIAALVLIICFTAVRCYGGSRYEEGKRQQRADSRRDAALAIERAVDSAAKVLVPVLDRLVRENDSLKTVARQNRVEAEAAADRARRTERMLADLPDSILRITPPEVRSLIDSLRTSNAALVLSIGTLSADYARLETHADSLRGAAESWKALQGKTKAALDSSQAAEADVRKLKDPPRCGWKCGALTTLGVVGSIFAAILLAGR